MYLYYVLAISILIIGFIVKGDSLVSPIEYKQSKILFLILSFGLMLFLSAFRDITVGSDTPHYETAYYFLSSGTVNGIYEPGFALLNRIVARLFGSYRALLIVTSAFMMIAAAIYIYYEAEDVILGTLCFYFVYFIVLNTMMRQGIALCIGMIAILLYRRNHKLSFYLLCVLAYTFHDSAFVLLLFPLFNKIKFKPSCIVVSFILGAAFNYFDLGRLVLGIIKLDTHYANETGASGLAAFAQCGIALYTLGCVYFSDNVEYDYDEDTTVLNWNFSGWCIVFHIAFYLFTISFPVMSRFSEYFAIGYLTLFPNQMMKLNNPRKRFVFICGWIAVYLLYQTLVFTYRPDWGGVFPFKFMWGG